MNIQVDEQTTATHVACTRPAKGDRNIYFAQLNKENKLVELLRRYCSHGLINYRKLIFTHSHKSEGENSTEYSNSTRLRLVFSSCSHAGNVTHTDYQQSAGP